MQRILVTVDFSKFDEPTLEMATSLYDGELNPSEEKLRQMLVAIVPDDASVAHEHHFIQGGGTASLADTDIASAISRFADEKDVDLIVTSTHGRSGFLRAFVGSVAAKIVGRATRPVLTVKLPQQSA